MIDQPTPDLTLMTVPASNPAETISQETNIMAIEALLELIDGVDADAGYAKAADNARSLAARTSAMVEDIDRTCKSGG